MRIRARYFGSNDKYYLHHLFHTDPVYRHNWKKIQEDPMNVEMWARMSDEDRTYVLRGGKS